MGNSKSKRDVVSQNPPEPKKTRVEIACFGQEMSGKSTLLDVLLLCDPERIQVGSEAAQSKAAPKMDRRKIKNREVSLATTTMHAVRTPQGPPIAQFCRAFVDKVSPPNLAPNNSNSAERASSSSLSVSSESEASPRVRSVEKVAQLISGREDELWKWFYRIDDKMFQKNFIEDLCNFRHRNADESSDAVRRKMEKLRGYARTTRDGRSIVSIEGVDAVCTWLDNRPFDVVPSTGVPVTEGMVIIFCISCDIRFWSKPNDADTAKKDALALLHGLVAECKKQRTEHQKSVKFIVVPTHFDVFAKGLIYGRERYEGVFQKLPTGNVATDIEPLMQKIQSAVGDDAYILDPINALNTNDVLCFAFHLTRILQNKLPKSQRLHVARHWSPEVHYLYSAKSQQLVKTMLLIRNRLPQFKACVSNDVMYAIFRVVLAGHL